MLTGRAPRGVSSTRGPGKVDLDGRLGQPSPSARDPGGGHAGVHVLCSPRTGRGFGKRCSPMLPAGISMLSSFFRLSNSGGQRSVNWFASNDLPRFHERGYRCLSLAHVNGSSPVSCHQMAKSRNSPFSLAGLLCVSIFQTQQEVWDPLLALTFWEVLRNTMAHSFLLKREDTLSKRFPRNA